MDKLWQEVSETTKGVYSSEECKRKWKNLCDRFMRIVSAEKLPSGAASQSKKNKWRFYESLNFLRDTLLRRETESNTSVCNNNVNVENEEEKEEESAQDDTPKNSKKQRINRNSNQDSVTSPIFAIT
ncbi:transcription factor Adf-1 [Mycetomoellerius zeteki]|uniref:transcription factor Adf-1 n=1 Tax=Mycetomoellerius zeteki TaxID=64791 RepID=UPI00084EB350|nr:PREDICTED: transcription factor Adf-1-like [Trachymyrmex zeteki]